MGSKRPDLFCAKQIVVVHARFEPDGLTPGADLADRPDATIKVPPQSTRNRGAADGDTRVDLARFRFDESRQVSRGLNGCNAVPKVARISRIDQLKLPGFVVVELDFLDCGSGRTGAAFKNEFE